MREHCLLGMKIRSLSKDIILEQIKKYISQPADFFHIVSINPENVIIAYENNEFKKVIETSQIQLIDGVGITLASKILGFEVERFTGVDLMLELIKLADALRLRALLIGGRPNLANQLAECYNHIYNQASFKGIEGIKNIDNPLKSEEKYLFSIVTQFKPQLLFTAFGSPEQELWLDSQKRQLNGIVCMGVGGAFDFLGRTHPRAPKFIRSTGLEWLFRLILEPWRWRRQLRLIKFIWFVIKEKYFYRSFKLL